MSESAAHFLLETRGTHRDLDAFVVAASFDRAGTHRWPSPSATARCVSSRSPTARPGAPSKRTTARSSRSHRTPRRPASSPAATTANSAASPPRAPHRHRRLPLEMGGARRKPPRREGQGPAGLRRRQVHPPVRPHRREAEGTAAPVLGHRPRVRCHAASASAASHYNGASLWFVAAKADSPRKLEWKGSHIAIAIHPDGDAVVTAMQENALHGWRLSDSQHMRMSGYPAKTESLSFTRNGKWLATSGADAMVLWPFFGGGPMGKAPIELAGGDGITCTQRRGASAAGDGGGRLRRRAGGAGGGRTRPASCRSRLRGTARSPRWPGARTAPSLPSARKRASRRSSTCRSADQGSADPALGDGRTRWASFRHITLPGLRVRVGRDPGGELDPHRVMNGRRPGTARRRCRCRCRVPARRSRDR